MTVKEQNEAVDLIINSTHWDRELFHEARILRNLYHKGIITFNETKEKIDQLREQVDDTIVFDMHFGAFTMKKKLEVDEGFFESAIFRK